MPHTRKLNKEKKQKKSKFGRIDSYQILPNFDFFIFPTFSIKLGHFRIQKIFTYAANAQA
jgi:hypothetical protein